MEWVTTATAVVALLTAFTALLAKWLSPLFKFKKEYETAINELVEDVKKLDRLNAKDFAAIQNNENLVITLAQTLLLTLSHQIDGNHIDKLKETRDRLSCELLESMKNR